MEKSCGCIVFNKNKVLLVKQKSGFCGFPKGHVEGDEQEISTAIREVMEETRIDVTVKEKMRYEISYLINDNVLKTVVYFVAYTNNINPIYQEEELLDAYFIEKDKVYDELTFDNLKELWLKVLGDVDGKVNI